jgi:hypothetical protein
MPIRSIVILSRSSVKAGGPEIGKLSMPMPSLGSGRLPAARASARAASIPARPATAEGAVAVARSSACAKVSGPALAMLGTSMANINR